jgi:hypothetical protein
MAIVLGLAFEAHAKSTEERRLGTGGDCCVLALLGPMRQHSRWTTGIDLLPNQLARSLQGRPTTHHT